MKAIVVKDNDFKTVGFEVTSNAKTLFSWGVSHDSPFYWTKHVNTSDWMTEIFELVKTSAELSEVSRFKSEFFDLALSHNLIPDGKAINFKHNAEKIASLKAKIENIISNII